MKKINALSIVTSFTVSAFISLAAVQAHAYAPANISDAQIFSAASGAKLSPSLKNQMVQLANEDLKKFSVDVLIMLNSNSTQGEAEAALGVKLKEVIGGNVAVVTLNAREVLFLTLNPAVQLIEEDGPLHLDPSFTASN